VPRDKRGRVPRCAMDRDREQVETVPFQVEVRDAPLRALACSRAREIIEEFVLALLGWS